MMHAGNKKNIIQSIYRNPSISTIRNTSFKLNKFMVIVTSELLIWYTFQKDVECIVQRRKIIVVKNRGHIDVSVM